MSLDAAALESFDENSAAITYHRSECVTFRNTTERWGGLSNMAAGFPLAVNGVAIRTSEAIYQACRFPHRPEVQRLIIAQASPMATKIKAKLHRVDSRRDFDALRVPIMEEVPPPAVADFLLYGEPIATVIGLAPSATIGQDTPFGGASSGRRPSAATPAGLGTFTCSRCFLVCHPSHLAPSRDGERVCRDCAT